MLSGLLIRSSGESGCVVFTSEKTGDFPTFLMTHTYKRHLKTLSRYQHTEVKITGHSATKGPDPLDSYNVP